MIEALRKKYEADIAHAKANIAVYLKQSGRTPIGGIFGRKQTRSGPAQCTAPTLSFGPVQTGGPGRGLSMVQLERCADLTS